MYQCFHLSGLYCFCTLYVSIYFVISVGCIVFVRCMYQFCHLSGLYCFCNLYVSILSFQWIVLFLYFVCINFVISVGCIVFVLCMYQFCHLSALYCFCPLCVSILSSQCVVLFLYFVCINFVNKVQKQYNPLRWKNKLIHTTIVIRIIWLGNYWTMLLIRLCTFNVSLNTFKSIVIRLSARWKSF